jgi:hypothetical protein
MEIGHHLKAARTGQRARAAVSYDTILTSPDQEMTSRCQRDHRQHHRAFSGPRASLFASIRRHHNWFGRSHRGISNSA